MSDPFVGPVPMRWEFDTLLNNLSVAESGDDYAAARADVCRAFDAQAARIAELEAALAGDAVAVVDVARWESAAKEGK